MEQNFNRRIETDLDLNGPHLTISSHPSDATVSDGATQTFSVTASATFPGNTGADDEGTLTYQWYEDDEGEIKKLTNETEGVTYSGVTTATLTLTNISSPAENGHKYYCVVDYTPAEKYGEGTKGTGHPINGTVTSNSATLTVNPYIQILSQPVSVDREYNVEGDISVSAVLSDSDYTDDIGYQWYRNNNAISDGRQTTTRIERGTVTEVIVEESEETYVVYNRYNYSYNNTFYHSSSAQTHAVPDTATNVKIKIAGAGGGRGGNDANAQGGSGGSGMYGEFNMTSAAGQTYTFYAGAKGSDGITGARDYFGGTGGAGGGYPNFGSGGTGGNSGPNGSSGGGGGGGGTSAVYHGSVSTPIIIAGGGGGGGGGSHVNLHGIEAGSPVSITYTSGYPKQQFGVHSWNGQAGKIIKYGDEGGGDANGELYITSGNATFTSYTQIVGSGPVRLQYNWSDMPNYSGRANDKIYIGNYATLEHPATRRGSNAAEFTLPGNAGSKNAGGWQEKGSSIYPDGGHGGHPCFCSDGGGGGGGGAGYVSSPGAGAGTGGAGGCDGVTGGTSGNGGESAYRTDYVAGHPSNGFNSGQGYVQLSYDYYVDVSETKTRTVVTQREVEKEIENSIPQNIDFSGTKGSTLTVKADYDTVENLKCIVSSPTATNSPVTTNTAQFSSFSNLANKNLYLEQVFWDNGTASALLATIDLNNGPVTLTLDDGSSGSGLNIFTCFYTTEDMYITVEMQGGRGLDYFQPAGVALPQGGLVYPGGKGGYGKIDMKIKANREFTVAGLFNGINTPYFYYKEYLIAVVGEGGQGGCFGAGGAGGGMSQGGFGYHGEGPKGGENGSSGRGKYGTANGGGGAPAGRQSFDGISNDAIYGPCYGTASSCNYISNVGWIGGNYAGQGWDNLACDSPSNRFCDGISYASYGGRVKATSKNNINGRSDSGYRDIDRKIKMRDGTFLNNTATIRRGFADIEGAFIATAGASRSGHVIDGLGGRGGNGALGGEGSAGGKGGGGGSGFLADFAYNKNIGVKEFDGVKFYSRSNSGKIDDGGAKVKISLDVTGNY
jgi:hypothetical protein